MYALETQRLGLRPFLEEDLEFLVELHADPDVTRYIGYGVPRTRAETQQFFEKTLKGYAEDSLGQMAVCLRGSGRLVGRCGLSRLEVESHPAAGHPPRWYWFRGSAPAGLPIEDDVELGYTFAQEHWGHGYATESAKAIRDLAFRNLNLQSFASAIAPANLASKNVARKLGSEFEGIVTAFDSIFECYRLSKERWLRFTNAA